jgi:hypothetical protein
MAAGGACLKLLEALFKQTGKTLADAEAFVADVGPGSFTGIRVGLTLAKMMAFVRSKPVAGVLSFDLVDPKGAVAIPCGKGRFQVRAVGDEPELVRGEPPDGAMGYGPSFEEQAFPHASKVAGLVEGLKWQSAFELLPAYLAEPSISTPKVPYRSAEGAIGG